MSSENLWEKVMKSARLDPEFLWHQNMVKNAEKVYVEVCKSLSPEQKLAIENYIAACEHLGDHFAALAYDLGKRSK